MQPQSSFSIPQNLLGATTNALELSYESRPISQSTLLGCLSLCFVLFVRTLSRGQAVMLLSIDRLHGHISNSSFLISSGNTVCKFFPSRKKTLFICLFYELKSFVLLDNVNLDM